MILLQSISRSHRASSPPHSARVPTFSFCRGLPLSLTCLSHGHCCDMLSLHGLYVSMYMYTLYTYTMHTIHMHNGVLVSMYTCTCIYCIRTQSICIMASCDMPGLDRPAAQSRTLLAGCTCTPEILSCCHLLSRHISADKLERTRMRIDRAW